LYVFFFLLKKDINITILQFVIKSYSNIKTFKPIQLKFKRKVTYHLEISRLKAERPNLIYFFSLHLSFSASQLLSLSQLLSIATNAPRHRLSRLTKSSPSSRVPNIPHLIQAGKGETEQAALSIQRVPIKFPGSQFSPSYSRNDRRT